MVTKEEIETLLKQTGRSGKFMFNPIWKVWYVKIDNLSFRRLAKAKKLLEKQHAT